MGMNVLTAAPPADFLGMRHEAGKGEWWVLTLGALLGRWEEGAVGGLFH